MYKYIVLFFTALCFTPGIATDFDLLQILKTKHVEDFVRINQEIQKTSLDMKSVLEEMEQKIPALLADRTQWKSYLIDYQPPYLMRIFCDVYCEYLQSNVRVNLHYFFPTTKEALEEHCLAANKDNEVENLYHPHAWASCMRILDGTYDQWIGFATQRGLTTIPPKVHYMTLQQGDSYAMNHPWLWHQVIPRANAAVTTLMVTYIPPKWDQETPKSTKHLRSLTEKELSFMFTHFAKYFSKTTSH